MDENNKSASMLPKADDTDKSKSQDLGNLVTESDWSLDVNNLIWTNITNLMSIKVNTENPNRPYSLGRLSVGFEALNYESPENRIFLYEERSSGYKRLAKQTIIRWIIFFLIGFITALVAFAISITVEKATYIKYLSIIYLVDNHVVDGDLFIPLLAWIILNIIPVIFGASLIVYLEPLALGSGIPMIKAYLNGVHIEGLMRVRLLVVKIIGVTCSIIGGLAGGKEGPMIHVGAVVGACLTNWKFKYKKREFQLFKFFDDDCEKRDFVCAGAAAGVAAAFGGPVGGILFCLEDGASFWKQSLTWRIFFSAVVTTFTLNFSIKFSKGSEDNQNLLNLGHFEDFSYEFIEIPFFILIGITGGLLGSLWIFISYKLQTFRKMYVQSNRMFMVVDACFVAAITAVVSFLAIYMSTSCSPSGRINNEIPCQVYCSEGHMNVLATFFFTTPERAIRSMLHDDVDVLPVEPLIIFCVMYFLLSVWTASTAASLGIVIACLTTGAAWGRLFGVWVTFIYPTRKINPGKYALIGACAQLGGVVRTTISLTVIIMETTGNSNVGFPVVITLMCAKWVADSFNKSYYDIVIMINGMPFLPSDPPPFVSDIGTTDIMSEPPVTVNVIDSVEHILEIITLTYNGFPVVDAPISDNDEPRKLRGFILKTQILIMLEHKLFVENNYDWKAITLDTFRHKNSMFSESDLTEEEKHYFLDFRQFMNPSPYTVQQNYSLSRIFPLVRCLGLRHLLVVNYHNCVIGVITRKDVAQYRAYRKHCKEGVEKLYRSLY